jgi:Diacylglycerol acyltransferase
VTRPRFSVNNEMIPFYSVQFTMVEIRNASLSTAPLKDDSLKTFTRVNQSNAARSSSKSSNMRWFIGMCMACCFSMIYFIAPFYMLSSLVILLYFYNRMWAWIYVSPMIISAMIPPIAMPSIIRCLSPMLDYFDYTEIHETSPIDVVEEIRTGRKNYLCIFQPHGVISFVGILSAVYASVPEFVGQLPTAVADALLYTPILKHVLGIFNLISASKQSLQKTMKKKGVHGTIVLYVGGMAELFLSCHTEEKLYLLKRKGFIKLALQEGVDIVPVYLFGNTTVLSILKTGFLANISRKVCVLLFWTCFFVFVFMSILLFDVIKIAEQKKACPHSPIILISI